MIVGMLACWKASKTAVPLDSTYPAARLSFIVDDAESQLLIGSDATEELARELSNGNAPMLNIDDSGSIHSDENLGLRTDADRAALLLYSSGTTGKPKGIIRTHRNDLQNCREYTNLLKLSPEDRLSHLHSTSFAAGSMEVLNAILNGASSCVWDARARGFVGLREWISTQRISVLNWIPSVFRQLMQTASGTRTDEFADVRLLMLGSETVTRRDVDLWRTHFPRESRFVCRLGSTEANNYRILILDQNSDFEGSIVPGGYPFGGKEVLLLDDSGQAVDFNQPGEIAIRSEYITPGYWKRPDLNEKAFRPDPEGGLKRIFISGDLGVMRPDGLLEFLGRKDSQLKILGTRIEAAEIEIVLQSVAGVRQAAVAAQADESGDNYLVAYIVPEPGAAVCVDVLRSTVAMKLPPIMVPSFFVTLDALPLTESGKLDRKSLPKPERPTPKTSSGNATTETSISDEIERIVRSIVTLRELTPEAHLLKLGVTSLEIVRILNRVEATYGDRPPIEDFYRVPTIAALANHVAGRLSLIPVDALPAPPLFQQVASEAAVNSTDRFSSMNYEEGVV